MVSRFTRTVFLLSLLALPLHASRTHKTHPASSTAQHLKDLAALRNASAEQYEITGHGAPRREFSQCERDIAQFQNTLKKAGITTLETPTCITLEGETESYAPAFRAATSEAIVPTMVLGGRFNSLSFCELETQRMAARISEKSKVLEMSCKPLRPLESAEEMFQPALIVLEAPKDPSLLKRYSSIGTLVESADRATLGSLSN